MKQQKKIQLTKETLRSLSGQRAIERPMTCGLDCATGSNPYCVTEDPQYCPGNESMFCRAV